MAAGAGDFQGALGVLLAANVLKVDGVNNFLREVEGGRALGRDFLLPGEMGHDVAEMANGENGDALDEGGLRGVGLGNEEAQVALFLGHRGHGQGAVYGADRAVQAQFADDQGVVQIGEDLAGGGHDAEGDGQVVGGAFFAQVGGGQIYCEAVLGKVESAVGDGRTDAFAAFAHGGAGEADDGEPLEPVCDIDFDFDLFGIQSYNGTAAHFGEHWFLRWGITEAWVCIQF